MAAIEPDQCRNTMAVKLDQPARGERGAVGKVAQKRTHAPSQAHPRFHRATASATLSLYPPQDNCGSPGVMAAAPRFGGLGHVWDSTRISAASQKEAGYLWDTGSPST